MKEPFIKNKEAAMKKDEDQESGKQLAFPSSTQAKSPDRDEHPVEAQFQSGLFKSVRAGDVVFCRMPGSEEFLSTIPEGHRCRPYLIVSKDGEDLYGFACSHKLSARIPAWMQYELSRQDYPQFEYFGQMRPNAFSTRVSLDQLIRIPAKNILSYSLHLHPEDWENILHTFRLIRHQNRQTIPDFLKDCDPDEIRPGDLLLVSAGLHFLVLESSRDQQAEGVFLHLVCPEGSASQETGDNPDQFSDALSDAFSDVFIDIMGRSFICPDTRSVHLKKSSENLAAGSFLSDKEIARFLLWKKRCENRDSTRSGFRFAWPSGSILLHQDTEWIYLYTEAGFNTLIGLEEFMLGEERLIKTDGLEDAICAGQIDRTSFLEIVDEFLPETEADHPLPLEMMESYDSYSEADQIP